MPVWVQCIPVHPVQNMSSASASVREGESTVALVYTGDVELAGQRLISPADMPSSALLVLTAEGKPRQLVDLKADQSTSGSIKITSILQLPSPDVRRYAFSAVVTGVVTLGCSRTYPRTTRHCACPNKDMGCAVAGVLELTDLDIKYVWTMSASSCFGGRLVLLRRGFALCVSYWDTFVADMRSLKIEKVNEGLYSTVLALSESGELLWDVSVRQGGLDHPVSILQQHDELWLSSTQFPTEVPLVVTRVYDSLDM